MLVDALIATIVGGIAFVIGFGVRSSLFKDTNNKVAPYVIAVLVTIALLFILEEKMPFEEYRFTFYGAVTIGLFLGLKGDDSKSSDTTGS